VARALILQPDLLIADEPTTMLDVSVRTGLLNLLKDMTVGGQLAMLFISHDFTTLSYLCDRIVIIYTGRVAEVGPANDVLTGGLHPIARFSQQHFRCLTPRHIARESKVASTHQREIPEGASSPLGAPIAWLAAQPWSLS